MNSQLSTNPWGRYRPSVEDHFGRCVDLLGRLARSFSGEIACDRHCARNLAHQLGEAVTYLIDTMVDVEGWLFHCDAECTWVEGGTSCAGYCELPRGHDGDHVAEVEPCPVRYCLEEARDARDGVVEAIVRLGWVVRGIDAGELSLVEDRSILAEADSSLAHAARGLDLARSFLAEVLAGKDQA